MLRKTNKTPHITNKTLQLIKQNLRKTNKTLGITNKTRCITNKTMPLIKQNTANNPTKPA